MDIRPALGHFYHIQNSPDMHPASLSPLYEAVQLAGIFPDSKFFPDCAPTSDPALILQAYDEAKEQPGFDLKQFVLDHFDLPETPDAAYQSANMPIREHLEKLWEHLLRQPNEDAIAAQASTLLPLPYPYIVPGGRFREVYYWDSYFTLLGLQVSGRVDVMEHMVDNFAFLLDRFGHIPNGNRTYYLSRSQPPFFALMVSLLAEIKGEETLLRYRIPLEKEYAFWMSGESELSHIPLEPEPAPNNPALAVRRIVRLPDGTVLNRYWDDDPSPRPEAYAEDVHTAQQTSRPAADIYRHLRAAAESGWDFSSRWLSDERQLASIHTTDFLPIDLNCLLYFLEKTLVRCHKLLPDYTPVKVYRDRARLRKAAILKHCWASEQGFFVDFNHREQKPSTTLTLAGAFPLFFQIAEATQAASAAKLLEEKFLRPGGLVTTLSHSGQQWDAPNGWAPLQWMAYRGLLHYGHTHFAEIIRQNWLTVTEQTYASTGKMMEKYNVENPNAPGGGGEYPNQDGFGWTNGVYLQMSSV